MIILASYDAGGGISHFTNRIYNILQQEYGRIKLYITKNSSSYIFFKVLLHYRPKTIIIHDYFPFLIQAAAHYKIVDSNTTLIFISLCKEEPPNGLELFDHILLPQTVSLHFSRNEHFIVSKDFYYPLGKKFKKTKWWNERKAFIYVGRICRSKINLELIKTLDNSNMIIDVYGNITEYDYYKILTHYKSFNYKGAAPHYKLPTILNNYKFHLLASQTDCFSISSLESAACGTIPVFVNCCRKLEWAKDISFRLTLTEFWKLIPLLITSNLEPFSTQISDYVLSLYNKDSFLQLFKEIKNDRHNRS